MNRFAQFTDEELAVLQPLIDQLAPAIIRYEEPQTTLVREFAGELTKRISVNYDRD